MAGLHLQLTLRDRKGLVRVLHDRPGSVKRPGLRLAIVAVLLAGCSVADPSASPASPSPLAPTPGSDGTPSVTSTPGPEPSATFDRDCPTLGAAYVPPEVWLDVRQAGPEVVSFELNVTRVVSGRDAAQVWERQPDPGRPDGVVRLVGGREHDVEVTIGGSVMPAVEIIAVDAVLHQATRSVRVEVRVDDRDGHRVIVLRAGNTDAIGELEIRLQWSDGCFEYEASERIRAEIASSGTIAGCPADDDAFLAYTTALRDDPLHVGGATAPLHLSSVIGLWSPNAVFADGHPFDSWDRTVAATVGAPGATLPVLDQDANLRLDSLSTEFFRRRDVIEWQDSADPYRRVFMSTAAPYPDGHFELLLPGSPARYVAVIGFNWDSPCMYGNGFSVLSIDVE